MEHPHTHFGWSTNLAEDVTRFLDRSDLEGLRDHLNAVWLHEVTASEISRNSDGNGDEWNWVWVSLLRDLRVLTSSRSWHLAWEISIHVQSARDPCRSIGTVELAVSVPRWRDDASAYCLEGDFAKGRLSLRSAVAFMSSADWSRWPGEAELGAGALCDLLSLPAAVEGLDISSEVRAEGASALARLEPHVSVAMRETIQGILSRLRPP